MINVAAICNIKNFPLMAEYGLATIFFLILSSIFYFIPVLLVSAELATGWPDRGVYTWVKEGLSPRLGFLAVWLQWIENVIWYPMILSFIAATFAYVFMPELAQNKIYVITVVLVAFWTATLVNFLGMKTSGWISSIGALFGTILPIALIILLGIFWLASGHTPHIQFNVQALIPDLTSIHELALLSGFLMSFAGMEMSAVHARDVKNPNRDYPKAILLSAVIIIAFSAIGSLTIAAVVPFDKIELTSGGMEAFTYLFNAFNMGWAGRCCVNSYG
jgi:amino acid transporter